MNTGKHIDSGQLEAERDRNMMLYGKIRENEYSYTKFAYDSLKISIVLQQHPYAQVEMRCIQCTFRVFMYSFSIVFFRVYNRMQFIVYISTSFIQWTLTQLNSIHSVNKFSENSMPVDCFRILWMAMYSNAIVHINCNIRTKANLSSSLVVSRIWSIIFRNLFNPTRSQCISKLISHSITCHF